MVAKRDDAAAGGFRFEPWIPVDDMDINPKTTFTDARDELYWLINNVAYARPEDERPALLAIADGCRDLSDQTVADNFGLAADSNSVSRVPGFSDVWSWSSRPLSSRDVDQGRSGVFGELRRKLLLLARPWGIL